MLVAADSPQAAALTPVSATDRFPLLDALRALALAGVCFANLEWFAGYRLAPQATVEHWPLADQITRQFSLLLIDSKAFGLFSLLFGVGFAVQQPRAEARGAGGRRLFARRLGVLLLLGLAHLLLLWYGDVLHWYALTGFGLLLFQYRPDRTLLYWGVALAAGAGLVEWGWSLVVPEMAEATRAGFNAKLLRTFAGDSYFATQRLNGQFVWLIEKSWGVPVLGAFLLGRLLLGYCFGRWALAVGLLGGLFLRVTGILKLHHLIDAKAPWLVVRDVIYDPVALATSVAYAAGFVLLSLRPGWHRRLAWLAPLGQMALTNYLMQTLIGLWLFYGYGLGLMGHVGPFGSVFVCLGELAFQLALSRWWLRRFRFGPAEWLWRSLTYGQWQPFRRARPALAPAPLAV